LPNGGKQDDARRNLVLRRHFLPIPLMLSRICAKSGPERSRHLWAVQTDSDALHEMVPTKIATSAKPRNHARLSELILGSTYWL
jgi:hypothetical protein